MISLAAGVLPDFSPLATVEAAAAAGFDAVGIWVDRDSWTDATTREVRDRLDRTGLPALDAEVIWLQPGPLDPWHQRMVDIGVALGARNLLVVSSDPDDGGTAAKLGRLCRHAGGAIRIALEFGLFTSVRTIGQAEAILAAVGHPAAALLVDPIHLVRSGGTPADVARVAPHLLPYAQFCDAGPLDYDVNDRAAIIAEAVDGRLLPGDGVLPLDAILRALPRDVPLSAELRSRALRDGYPDAADRARAVATATRAFLAKAHAAQP